MMTVLSALNYILDFRIEKIMAPRRKPKRRARPKTISALNVLESYTYASILSQGLAGTSPLGLITGKGDLTGEMAPIYGDGIYGNMELVGAGEISLQDMIQSPTAALGVVQGNFMANYQGMILQSLVTRFGYKFARKALRVPINNVNRNIMKNLGLGVRI